VLHVATLLRQRATRRDLRVLDISKKRRARLCPRATDSRLCPRDGGGFRLTQVKHLLRDVSEVIEASFLQINHHRRGRAGDLWPFTPTHADSSDLLNLAVNARDAMLRVRHAAFARGK